MEESVREYDVLWPQTELVNYTRNNRIFKREMREKWLLSEYKTPSHLVTFTGVTVDT